MCSDDKTLRKTQWKVVGSYLAVFLIGIPFWWKITTVQRSALPITELQILNQSKIIPINFNFHVDEALNCNPAEAIPVGFRDTQWQVQVNEALRKKSETLQKNLSRVSQWNVRLTTNVLGRPSPTSHPFCIRFNGKSPNVSVKADGKFYISAENPLNLSESLNSLSHHLFRILMDPPESVRFAKGYEILLSLLVQDPSNLLAQKYKPTWNVHKVIRHHLEPLLMELFANDDQNGPQYKLSSQIQYYTNPGVGIEYPASSAADSLREQRRVKKGIHSKGTWNDTSRKPATPVQEIKLQSNQLQHFVSSDWNLASVRSNYSVINLVTFIPSPLFPINILDGKGASHSRNDIIIPRWGGVQILNPTEFKSSTLSSDIPFDYQRVGEMWVSQLREVLGISQMIGKKKIRGKYTLEIENPESGLHSLERDVFHLSQMLLNAEDTLRTLNALYRMTESLASLPVPPSIVEQFRRAIELCKSALSENYSPKRRYLDAFQARKLADAAFFDKDMVGLVYFPDEHKYAVYMPFFLPVIVTMLGVLVQEGRSRLKKRKMKS